MAIIGKDDALAKLKAIVGDNQTDEAITLMEDISDTYDDFDSRLSDTTDWHQRYEDNDREWRQRYTDRFMKGSPDEDEDDEDEEEKPKLMTRFEDLFTVKEK